MIDVLWELIIFNERFAQRSRGCYNNNTDTTNQYSAATEMAIIKLLPIWFIRAAVSDGIVIDLLVLI